MSDRESLIATVRHEAGLLARDVLRMTPSDPMIPADRAQAVLDALGALPGQEQGARRELFAARLKTIGGFIDRVDQRDLMPEDEVGETLQALVDVQHWLGQMIDEQAQADV